MKKTLTIYKRIGETPLEAINRLKKKNPWYQNVKISYAGRLDPMARGKLLLLLGEENKNRVLWEKKDKKYVFEVLFGVSTDSDDVLGLVQEVKQKSVFSQKDLTCALSIIKNRKFQYPPIFSSVRFKGKPLYYWARKDKKTIKLKKRKIIIYSINILKTNYISTNKLKIFVKRRIALVKGSFRQKEVLLSWEKNLKKSKDNNFLFKVVKIRVKCSSGTYARSIAKDLGKALKLPSLALNIKRTKIY